MSIKLQPNPCLPCKFNSEYEKKSDWGCHGVCLEQTQYEAQQATLKAVVDEIKLRTRDADDVGFVVSIENLVEELQDLVKEG